jgi:TolB-like protein/DNA-binding winged helix-turn-helix (wHTH) protein/tetratricopeptide (TPR) repeat protein
MDIFSPEQGCFRWGRFTLDPLRRSMSCDGKTVKLAERLFDVLLYLVANHGRVVERDELLREIWAGRVVEDNNVSQAIFELRKVLKSSGSTDRSIVTVPGKGFRFVEPVVLEPAPTAALADQIVSSGASWWRGHIPLGVALFSLIVAGLCLAFWTSKGPVPVGGRVAETVFSPPAHSVAVLAFDNMSGDLAQSYVSDGLSEQLIDALTQIDAMRVAARISTFSFRGRHVTIDEIGRALNVGAVLAGSVRRRGTRIIVTAQLTNARTGFNIWSQTYDRDQNEIVNIQSDIVLAVARSMQVVLPGDEQPKLTFGGTHNAAAYDAYLRGLDLQRSARDVVDYQAALAEFDRALAVDPGFALGYAKRAITIVAVVSLGTDNPAVQRHLMQEALSAANRAVALSPMLGAAHSARGAVLGHLQLDYAGAFGEQVKAQALAPGNASIESNYASAALALGHVEQAIAAARRAAELDPLDPNSWGQLGQVLYEGHRYGEALNALDRERVVFGGLPLRHSVLQALVLLMSGHAKAARTLCAAGSDWQENQLLALADHALGQQAAAEADLAKVRAALGDDAASNYAEIYAQWDRKTEALRWFDKAVQMRDPGLLDVLLDPLLDPIRKEPKFKATLARLRFVEGE